MTLDKIKHILGHFPQRITENSWIICAKHMPKTVERNLKGEFELQLTWK